MNDTIGTLAGILLSVVFIPAVSFLAAARIRKLEDAIGWITILSYLLLLAVLHAIFGWPRLG